MRAIALAAAAAAAVFLSACDSQPMDPEDKAARDAGLVVLVAVAPDGTHLWSVIPPGSNRVVYFASTGSQASHTQSCGKSCRRTVDVIVPTFVPGDPLAGAVR